MAAEAADELVAKAEKKLKGGVFGSMFGNKKEEAQELLQEAANKYKQVRVGPSVCIITAVETPVCRKAQHTPKRMFVHTGICLKFCCASFGWAWHQPDDR